MLEFDTPSAGRSAMLRGWLSPLLAVLAICWIPGSARAAEEPEPACPPATETTVECFSYIVPEGAFPSYGGSGERGGFSPSDLRSAYKIPEKVGSTQTIAIVDAFDDPNAEADVNTYRSRYGLSECTTAGGCFKKVNQSGEAKNYPAANGGWALETSLDLDMASAICPECHLLLVEANSASFTNMAIAEDRAATLGASAISDSWGNVDNSERSSELSHYEHPGIPILVASGDQGYAPGVSFPASLPSVVAVGGTHLEQMENARGWREKAWPGTGSGCAALRSKPTWQTDASCSHRTDNDTAAVADPETPVSVYDSYGHSWVLVGGTSAAAPILAGVEAISSSGARALGAEAFYKAGPAGHLFDVTEGANGICGGSYLCTAKVGYDGPTGWGTPDGRIVVEANSPLATTGGASGLGAGTVTLHGSVTPRGLDSTYDFEYGRSKLYGHVVPLPGKAVGWGDLAVEVEQALSDLQLGATYHYRITATNSKGTAHGEDATVTLPASAYVSSFGSFGTGNGQFNHPGGIGETTEGNFWIADVYNHRLEKLSSKGEYISQVSKAGDGQTLYPSGLAVDAKDDVWITDWSNERVEEFNAKGEFVRRFGSFGTGNGQFNNPEGIAVDSEGNVWVADWGNGRVQEFNEKGEFIRLVGSKGSEPGQLQGPAAIAVGPGNSIWVADWSGHRVDEFNSKGEYVRRFGSEGTGNGQFSYPVAIAADSTGHVWVADQENGRVEEFNGEGTYLGQFGSVGSGEGQFRFGYPNGIVAEPDGDLWITDGSNSRVQRWGN